MSAPSESASPTPEPLAAKLSLLQEMMVSFERETGLYISFDDLTGALTGAHEDVPTMRIHFDYQNHTCKFCVFAKSTEAGLQDCVRNKVAVNRLVMHRRAGLEGFCHLGLFDIAEPLIHRGRVLGVFYGGSAVVRGQEEVTRERVRRACARRGWDPQPHLEALALAPTVDPADIPAHRHMLRMIAHVAQFFYEASGVRPEIYKLRPLKHPYEDPLAMPFVVKATLQYAQAHLHEPFSVKDIAARLHCHPDFLSRKFKQHAGIDLSLYLQQARIERAKQLLENPRITIDEASEQSGFSDRFHFSKVFRRVTGGSPGAFQKQILQQKTRA